MNIENIETLQARCQNYLRSCLEFWATTGYDHQNGGYHEAVSLEGKPLQELNRRFRVQARNIFSHAAGSVDGYGDFIPVAESAFSYVRDHYWQEGGFSTLCDPQGNVLDESIFSYDHAFMILASAWLYSVTGKEEHRRGLEDTWGILSTRLRSSRGGVLTSVPPPEGHRIEQNPHMHLFESLMDTHLLTGEESWLREAQTLYGLYRDYFYSEPDRLIREFFYEDYTPYTEREWVDPGHHYEWTWLLNKYEKLSGEKTISIPEIFDYAETRGRGKEGLIYEFLLPDDRVVKSTHRMWSQTEQIKARLTMYERTGQSEYFDSAVESVETLFRVFCHPDLPGVWYDCLDEEGHRVSDKSPASTLYHLYIALQEFIRVSKTVLGKETQGMDTK